jgi:hypothetical protein
VQENVFTLLTGFTAVRFTATGVPLNVSAYEFGERISMPYGQSIWNEGK